MTDGASSGALIEADVLHLVPTEDLRYKMLILVEIFVSHLTTRP
jgi:hypothetical protein